MTNEPGYYEDGNFGIRIENVMITQKAETPNAFGGTTFLGFETITAVPIQSKLINVALLTAAERQWGDRYHAWCRAELAPLLPADSAAARWLHRWTEPLPSAGPSAASGIDMA